MGEKFIWCHIVQRFLVRLLDERIVGTHPYPLALVANERLHVGILPVPGRIFRVIGPVDILFLEVDPEPLLRGSIACRDQLLVDSFLVAGGPGPTLDRILLVAREVALGLLPCPGRFEDNL